MFDIKWIRENPEAFDAGLARRNLEPLSPGLIDLDTARRAAETKAQEIQADRNKIEQVFANLIDNAIKYTKETGRIEILIREKDQTVCVTVQDNGIGIPKEHRDRVFERFYRVDKARSRELGGTGLGLSIVKHIVLAHNGKIAIESEPNRGTKVSVTFPKS